jgi:hypothetical protein
MKLNENRNIIIKKADPFLKRFEGRYEKIGAGGIKEVTLKNSVDGQFLFKNKKEIKENPIINDKKNNKKLFSRMMNQYNILAMKDYQSIPKNNIKSNLTENTKYEALNNKVKKNDYNNENNYNFNNNNINIITNNNKSKSNNNPNNQILNYNYNNNLEDNNANKISPKLNHNNSYPTYESINSNNNYSYNPSNKLEPKQPDVIENERFYKPHSLKEYKNIMENYKNNRFGGLGKNMNKEWKEREKIINKVKRFENSVLKNFNIKVKDFNYKRVESPQKMELIKIGKQIMNSKRFIAQKYGKNVVLNKVRNKRKNDKADIEKIRKLEEEQKYLRLREYERKQRDEDIFNIYDKVIQDKKDNYMDKLMKLKSSLI